MLVHACICVYMRVNECICVYMRVCECICVYMRVYACICVVYAAKGGQEAGKGRKRPTPQNDEKSNLKNKKKEEEGVFVYCFGWG